MYSKSMLLIIIFVVSIILAFAFGYLNFRHKRRGIDYYMMFIVGVAWTLLGFAFKITFLTFMGIVFSLWGFVQKSHWDDDIKNLKREHREELFLLKTHTNKIELVFGIIIFCGIVILAGIILYIYLEKLRVGV